MKNIIIPALLALIAAGCQPAEDRSNHNNPAEVNIPGKAFTVTVCDRQPGIEPDSTYFFYGVLTKNADDGIVNFTEGTCTGSDYRFRVKPDPVKLIQTGYNEITFETSEDVNASSSDKALDIVKIDSRHFRLACHQIIGSQNSIDEGTARIRFWNGSGNGEKSISINVDARSSVRIEGFEFRLDGEQFLLKEVDSRGFRSVRYNETTNWQPFEFKTRLRFIGKDYEASIKDNKIEDLKQKFDIAKGSCLEFVGTIPRNATPDNNVRRLVDAVSMRTEGNYVSWDYMPFYYYWNEAGKYPEYRWMPFNFAPVESVNSKGASTKFYPADLRYRKAWIWNRTLKKAESDEGTSRMHFCYICYDGDTERAFVGCIREK